MDVKIAACYVRVSTDDQQEYSPDSQLKIVRDYAKREGFIVPDEYVFQEKEGISGKTAEKRPRFRMMIATAKQDPPPFSAIFVWKFSRFARNQEEAIMYKNLLRKRGIDVRSVSEPSSDDPFSSLIERIIEWMDEYYLINLAEEVRRGMKEKSRRGEACGRAPFGYDVQNKILVPNKDAEIVRFIYDRFASGSGIRGITAELVRRGIKTKNGLEPSIRWTRYILMNPVYIGKLRWNESGHLKYERPNVCAGGGDLSDGQHEPIIDMQTWEIAQKKLTGKDPDYYRRTSGTGEVLLRGLVRCSSCGNTLIRITQYGRGYLQCCSYTRGTCKVSHRITEQEANDAVLDALEQCIANETYTIERQKPETPVSPAWEPVIAAEQKKLDRATEAFLNGVFSNEEFKNIRQKIQKKIQDLQLGIENDQKTKEQKTDISQVKERTVKIMDILRSPDVPVTEKNRQLRTVIDKIVFDRSAWTFDVYFKP